MRVATWNVNGLNARLAFLQHWLAERQPDLVGLQEIKMVDEQFPRLELKAAGYETVSHGQKSWNGVALLAREEIETVASGLPGQEDFGARLLHGRLPSLDFITVYCPNGKNLGHADFPRKLAWFDSLVPYVEQALASGRPTVLGGDFNICPTPLDSWDESRHEGDIFHTGEERGRFQKLLDLGLQDLYRSLHPDTQAFSWWDYRGGAFHKKQGLRIDFLLGNEAAVQATTAAEIDRDYRKKKDGLSASDHAPVMVDLSL